MEVLGRGRGLHRLLDPHPGHSLLGPTPLLRRRLGVLGAATIPPPPATSTAGGLAALLITCIVAGVVTPILIGPVQDVTLRGQVYFAVAVGLLAGAYLARRLTGVQSVAWFWPAPFVVGVFGLCVAGINPVVMIPLEYRQLDTLPAWGLARALPVEMIGVGLVAALSLSGHPAPPDAEPAGE